MNFSRLKPISGVYLTLKPRFNSNTTDGLYCGSFDTCSAPATTGRPFSKVHLSPTSSPQRVRVTRASGVFIICLHQKAIKICISDLRMKASPRFPSPAKAKRAQSSTCKMQVISELWVNTKSEGGIANSLSARCAGACLFARTKVRVGHGEWQGRGRSVRLFHKKQGGKKRKAGAFRKKVHKFLFNLSV